MDETSRIVDEVLRSPQLNQIITNAVRNGQISNTSIVPQDNFINLTHPTQSISISMEAHSGRPIGRPHSTHLTKDVLSFLRKSGMNWKICPTF